MKKLLLFQIILLSVIILFFSCLKKEEYSIVPVIKFKSLIKIDNATGIDDKGLLTLTFTDGDGDIGLNPDDTTGIYSKDSLYNCNFFIKYFEKQKGKFKEIVLPLKNNSRIPFISVTGKNKNIKGEIEIELYINNYTSAYDTILFEAYIVDRALHKSNIIKTPEIIIKKK